MFYCWQFTKSFLISLCFLFKTYLTWRHIHKQKKLKGMYCKKPDRLIQFPLWTYCLHFITCRYYVYINRPFWSYYKSAILICIVFSVLNKTNLFQILIERVYSDKRTEKFSRTVYYHGTDTIEFNGHSKILLI